MNLSSPSAVHALLKRHNLQPRRRFGQNFLVDGNTLARIVDAGALTPGAQVLEIGAGLGVLTNALADAVTLDGRVITVEIDRHLLPVLATGRVTRLAQARNIIRADGIRDQFNAPFPSCPGLPLNREAAAN